MPMYGQCVKISRTNPGAQPVAQQLSDSCFSWEEGTVGTAGGMSNPPGFTDGMSNTRSPQGVSELALMGPHMGDIPAVGHL